MNYMNITIRFLLHSGEKTAETCPEWQPTEQMGGEGVGRITELTRICDFLNPLNLFPHAEVSPVRDPS